MRVWLAVSLCLISQSALAQHHSSGGGGSAAVHGTGATNGPITFSLDKSRSVAADGARAKAVAGDCKGALDLFDEALRHSVEPALYRDRGACHEKLGNVFPALDDYRAYVSQAPNAPDADKIRERIDSLIKTGSQDMAPNLGRGGDFDSEMRGGMTDGSTPVTTTNASKPKDDDSKDAQGKPEDPNKPLKTIEYEEGRDKQAESGPLRKGRGLVLGVFLWPRYVVNDYTFQFGQGVAIRVGYSLSSSSTLAIELGYMNQLSTGSASTTDGFTGTFNYEFRIPLDRWADNQLVAGAGAGFEDLTRNDLQLSYASFIGRGRFGYRHVFGPSLALDIAADGGLMITLPVDPPPNTKTASFGGFVGGIVALSVGF